MFGHKTGTGYFLALFQRYRESLDVNLNSRGNAVLKKSSLSLFSASVPLFCIRRVPCSGLFGGCIFVT
jgi:hypothetical protein